MFVFTVLAVFALVVVAFALGGLYADSRHAGGVRPYLLRTGRLRRRAIAVSRFYHDVGDSHSG